MRAPSQCTYHFHFNFSQLDLAEVSGSSVYRARTDRHRTKARKTYLAGAEHGVRRDGGRGRT